jgi:hypothetical protein
MVAQTMTTAPRAVNAGQARIAHPAPAAAIRLAPPAPTGA